MISIRRRMCSNGSTLKSYQLKINKLTVKKKCEQVMNKNVNINVIIQSECALDRIYAIYVKVYLYTSVT